MTLLSAFRPAGAWGVLGHQVVADLAEDMLTPKARTQALSLLGPPSGGGTGGPGARLSSIAVWADDIKSLRPETRSWHYVTLQVDDPDLAAAAAAGRPPDSPNVVTALKASLAVLRNAKADRYAREEALKWIVHLIGDLHQPLHVGEDRDRGGNLAKVKVGRRTRNLHEVWDYVLLERLHLPADSLRALLARSLASDPGFLSRHAGGTVEAWVDETHAKTSACYTLHGKRMRRGIAVSLDRTYLRPNTLVALNQLKIAAVRLAAALNAALDPTAPALPLVPAVSSAQAASPPGLLREDTAAYFRSAEPDPAPVAGGEAAKADSGSGTAAGSARAGQTGGGRFAWSVNSKVYHFADCADVSRVKRKNLRRGDIPPPQLTLHPGCPKRD